MSFADPTPGASLILSFRLDRKTTLIVGGNSLAATRAFSSLEADSQVHVLARGTPCDELRWRAEKGQLLLHELPHNHADDASALEKYLASTQISLVCITDTLSSFKERRSKASATALHEICQKRRVLVNVTDHPELCDFSFTSTHRFSHSVTGAPTPLQIGITTNGRGCRLSGRVKREIVSRLPKEVGAATEKVGRLRALAKSAPAEEAFNECTEDSTPNRPVPQRTPSETVDECARRRMKWVAQVSEYWPIPRLAELTDQDTEGILAGESRFELTNSISPTHSHDSDVSSVHQLHMTPPQRKGRIVLVGSGPGHPSLLTIATHDALTKHAHLVLSDKLVPAAVLDLIPSHVKVQIARKFPGNAEGAQTEMQEAAVEAAQQGLTVVRLKQGDPTVYGRAGEEVLYFRSKGFEPTIVPGVTSALAGPIFAGIPVTQRGAAESFMVCTGVGKGGKEVTLPGYDRGRTLVILMGVARLQAVLETLQNLDIMSNRRTGPAYPSHTPIAIIERASMSDQRIVYSTLRDIGNALDSVGEQRPPGMIVVGWSVLCLWNKGDMKILDEGAEADDQNRVKDWLENKPWRFTEGLDDAWAM